MLDMRARLLLAVAILAVVSCRPSKRMVVQEPAGDTVTVQSDRSESDEVEDTVSADTAAAVVEPRQSHSKSKVSSRYDFEEYEERQDEKKGDKYDRRKYHTDYNNDDVSQKMRRDFIDADGYDDNDDYDEYYGYGWRQY